MKPAAAVAPTVRWFHCLTCGEEFERREDHDYKLCQWRHDMAQLDALEHAMLFRLEYQA